MSNIYRTTNFFFIWPKPIFVCICENHYFFHADSAPAQENRARAYVVRTQKQKYEKNKKSQKNQSQNLSKVSCRRQRPAVCHCSSSSPLPSLSPVARRRRHRHRGRRRSSPHCIAPLPPDPHGGAWGRAAACRSVWGSTGEGPTAAAINTCLLRWAPHTTFYRSHSRKRGKERRGEERGERRGEDRLNTRDMLHGTNLSVNSGANCVLLLCNTSMPEDSNHTFFTCSFTNQCRIFLGFRWETN